VIKFWVTMNTGVAGFVYVNKTGVDDGVSARQLKHIVHEYVSAVYASDTPDLYDVLLYQYYGLVVLLYQYYGLVVLLYQYYDHVVLLYQYYGLVVLHYQYYGHAVLLHQYYGHVQHDWTSSRSGRDRAAIRDLLMRMLADGHQVSYTHNTERKCADTIGTVPVPLAGHFQWHLPGGPRGPKRRFELAIEVQRWTRARSECLPGAHKL